MNELEWQQMLSVDYEKIKQFIQAYHRIYRILTINKTIDPIYSNFFIIKTSITLLEAIGSTIKDLKEVKRRKKPILQPLILTIYEYFLNLNSQAYSLFNTSIFTTLKRLIKIDEKNTILFIYYLSRVLNFDGVIDVFIELLQQS